MKFKNIKFTQRNRKQATREAVKRLAENNALNTLRHSTLDYAAFQEKVRSVLFDCMEFVLLEQYNESPEVFAEHVNTAEVILKQYAVISRDMSKAAAEKWLSDKLNGKYCVTFMLPVVEYPKKGKERIELNFVRQEAALWAKAFCYAFGQVLVKDTKTTSMALEHDRYNKTDIDDIFCTVAKQYRERAILQRS